MHVAATFRFEFTKINRVIRSEWFKFIFSANMIQIYVVSGVCDLVIDLLMHIIFYIIPLYFMFMQQCHSILFEMISRIRWRNVYMKAHITLKYLKDKPDIWRIN